MMPTHMRTEGARGKDSKMFELGKSHASRSRWILWIAVQFLCKFEIISKFSKTLKDGQQDGSEVKGPCSQV